MRKHVVVCDLCGTETDMIHTISTNAYFAPGGFGRLDFKDICPACVKAILTDRGKKGG